LGRLPVEVGGADVLLRSLQPQNGGETRGRHISMAAAAILRRGPEERLPGHAGGDSVAAALRLLAGLLSGGIAVGASSGQRV
jgi:hypothetical protein